MEVRRRTGPEGVDEVLELMNCKHDVDKNEAFFPLDHVEEIAEFH